MKIHEFSKLTHVNAETIRMYRNKGLLHPIQDEKGHYEYSNDDLIFLLFIRKLRGMNLSIPSISYTYEHNEALDIVTMFQKEYDAIEENIRQLRKQQEMLRLHISHYHSYLENDQRGITELQVSEDRYDQICDGQHRSPELNTWIAHVDQFTPGLYIPGEYLQMDPLPQKIPVSFTLGSYLPILEQEKLPIPSHALYYPRGRYLTGKVVLRNVKELEGRQLLPLLDYAQDHGYRLVGDGTAFLFRIARTSEGLQFLFRVRFRVEEAAP